jgi:hypothetical protein
LRVRDEWLSAWNFLPLPRWLRANEQ